MSDLLDLSTYLSDTALVVYDLILPLHLVYVDTMDRDHHASALALMFDT